jgi:hypothetical protein
VSATRVAISAADKVPVLAVQNTTANVVVVGPSPTEATAGQAPTGDALGQPVALPAAPVAVAVRTADPPAAPLAEPPGDDLQDRLDS